MNNVIPAMLAAGETDIDASARAAYRTLLNAGSAPASTGLSANHTVGLVNKLILTLADFEVTVANVTGASFGGAKIYDFPEGRILVLGVVADLSFNWAGTDIAAAGSGDFSLGTTITADGSLATTEVDLCPSSPMTDPFVTGVGRGVGALAAGAQFDGTATAKDANINIIIDDADVSDAASDIVKVSGTVTIVWIKLGDYTAL
jgi:hypothetical protein